MDAGVQVEAFVHGGVGDARGRLGKLVLGALAGVLRRLESAPLHPRKGHGLAHAVRRRLVRGVRLAEETAARLMASAATSRRRAKRFDNIPFKTLARASAEHLGRLFTHAGDFGLQPSRLLLATVGLKRSDLREHDDVLSVDAAVRAADSSQVVVEAL